MKVYEILSEAPEYTSPGGIVIPAGSKTAEPLPKPETPAEPPKTPNAARRANAKIKNVFTTVSDVNKEINRRIGSAISRKDRRAEKIDAKWKNSYGFALTTFMRLIGIAGAITDLYVELDHADEMFKNEEISAEILKEYRQWSFGRFELQVLVPAVTRFLGRATGVAATVRWIKNGLAMFGSTVSFGATAAAALASEAFFIWLQRWLSSPQANEWFAHGVLRYILETGGSLPESMWSDLTGYYEKDAKKKPATSAKPAAGATAPAGGATPSPAQPENPDAERIFKKLGI